MSAPLPAPYPVPAPTAAPAPAPTAAPVTVPQAVSVHVSIRPPITHAITRFVMSVSPFTLSFLSRYRSFHTIVRGRTRIAVNVRSQMRRRVVPLYSWFSGFLATENLSLTEPRTSLVRMPRKGAHAEKGRSGICCTDHVPVSRRVRNPASTLRHHHR